MKKLAIPLSLSMVLLCAFSARLQAQSPAGETVPRMTGRYHFLGPEDTLSILQEENVLKGYIDVFEGDSESDDVLSYQITIGSRQGNHVEFRTRPIHEKFYRFNGIVERGTGKKPSDPDYLQLNGDLVILVLNSVTGQKKSVSQKVILKSIPRGQGPPD